MNYTFIIKNDGKSLYCGPYQHHGSDRISKTVSSGLAENREYTLMVKLHTEAGVSYSQQYDFSKNIIIVE